MLSWWCCIWEDYQSSWKNTVHITMCQHSRAEIELGQMSLEITFFAMYNFLNRSKIWSIPFCCSYKKRCLLLSWHILHYAINIYSGLWYHCRTIEYSTLYSLNFILESCCSIRKTKPKKHLINNSGFTLSNLVLPIIMIINVWDL